MVHDQAALSRVRKLSMSSAHHSPSSGGTAWSRASSFFDMNFSV